MDECFSDAFAGLEIPSQTRSVSCSCPAATRLIPLPAGSHGALSAKPVLSFVEVSVPPPAIPTRVPEEPSFKSGSPSVKRVLAIACIVLVGLFILFFVLPVQVERRSNRTLSHPPYHVSGGARALHQRLFIADLHADSLLWNRDLNVRNTRGHVDVPRLIEGHVGLQAFTIVTKVPIGFHTEPVNDTTDYITLLAIAQRWPVATWGSLLERALYQARKLHEFAARSRGKLVIIKTASDLARYIARRQHESGITAGLLGVEGAHALEGNLRNIDVLFDAGIRMIAPTHFFDNEIGGSAHGIAKGGLTETGREMIKRMHARRMVVDLAHASSRVIDDVVGLSTKPVVVSHTGVRGTCDHHRTLRDDQITGIAQTGGVIGIGYWEGAVCGKDAKAIARAIRYTADLAGVKHVALGSDFDGVVTTPFDATGLIAVTDALLDEGFSDEDVKMIMGGNVARVLMQTLP